MKLTLHIVYSATAGSAPVALTDENYKDFKETFGICEKQNALYYESGNFAGLVHHTDIEVDTESEYQNGYHDGFRDCEGGGGEDDWQKWTPVFPQN